MSFILNLISTLSDVSNYWLIVSDTEAKKMCGEGKSISFLVLSTNGE